MLYPNDFATKISPTFLEGLQGASLDLALAKPLGYLMNVGVAGIQVVRGSTATLRTQLESELKILSSGALPPARTTPTVSYHLNFDNAATSLIPPRTVETSNLANQINDGLKGVVSPDRQVIMVAQHADGTISVGFSGQIGDKFTQQVKNAQAALDRQFGVGKVKVSPYTLNKSNGIQTIQGGNTAGVCAEPKCASIAGQNFSRITSYSVKWRGDVSKNKHPYLGSVQGLGANEMAPCLTCGHQTNQLLYWLEANRGVR